MKNSINIVSVIIVVSLLSMLTSCRQSNPYNPPDYGINPFTNGGNERNMIVVISDIHLGADLAYAECNKNLGALALLLEKIRVAPNIRELVIAGDLLDEWFVPAPIDTYQGKDQRDFVLRIAETNRGVMNDFNNIIKDRKILVTYVPGNHDLTITPANVNLVLPGIHQARDTQLGLGTYSPADCPKIAIEHGHRYNFFCAPDQFSNQDIAPGNIMPPGYFFTRIGALHVSQNLPPAGDTLPVVVPNTSAGQSQNLLYVYLKVWQWAINYLTIKNKFDEKIIVTNVNGFTATYSVNDLLPYQTTAGGLLNVNLYKGIQDTWDQRQTLNQVAVKIPAAQAIANAASGPETDNQAKIQYFDNPNFDKRIVVFGHSHIAKIISTNNHSGQKSIYANSGTWIDNNKELTFLNFVVITPQKADASSQTYVKLYNFEGKVVTEMAKDSLRY
ncbi:MAG: metallophosphoesterase [Prolixibacteraceae bacterium]|nr:metallophosphoesterase [Prolixibacteraceae bacterium]